MQPYFKTRQHNIKRLRITILTNFYILPFFCENIGLKQVNKRILYFSEASVL
jgi:hypothetical protein